MSIWENVKYQTWIFWQEVKIVKVGNSVLSVFGGLWLVIEILAFFNKNEFSNDLRSIWWVILILGVILILYQNWPKTLHTFKVKNRDVSIAIKVGDIFKIDGSIIIPINHKLDCNNNGIVEKSSSILKHFIKQDYNSKHSHLQTDINHELEDQKDWYDKFIVKQNPVIYKIGTVVPIFKDEKHHYMLCSSKLNEKGKSKTTEDDLQIALSELWVYLNHSGNNDSLVMPIIGTGRGRITSTREEVIKEIVLSFLVSLSSGGYCEQLTICIHPKDIKKFKINLSEIFDFIKLHCENTSYKKNSNPGSGTSFS